MPFKFYYRITCFVLLNLLTAHYSNSQYNESDFVRYTVKEGLSHNYVSTLQQDEYGYMWIGTNIGLNRFDGNSFKSFYQGTAPIFLPSSRIVRLKLFDNHLGIISRGGFQVLDIKTLSPHNYFIADSSYFTTYQNAVWDAARLPDQSFAVSTATGFNVFDASGKITFRHNAYQKEDVGKKRIFYGRNIFPVSPTEYLIYIEQNKMALYNSEQHSYRHISPTEKEWTAFYPPGEATTPGWVTYAPISPDEYIFIYTFRDSIVYYNHALKKTVHSALPFNPSNEFSWESKIVVLSDSSFAINSAYAGFYTFRLDRTSGKITCRPEKFLPSFKVNCLYLDRDRRLWAGTAKGLLRQKINTPLLQQYSYASGDNPRIGFLSAYRYKDKLYVGRYSRVYGLLVVDTASMKEQKRIEFYGKNSIWNEVLSIQMYHPDTLWIGSNGGILWFDTKTHRYGKVLDKQMGLHGDAQQVQLSRAGKDGYAWFCYMLQGVAGKYHIPSRSFTFYTTNTHPAIPFERVKNIAYDANGDVWLGGHALARWSNRKQQFDTVIHVYAGPNKYNDDILAMTSDDSGSLWLHNAENSLLEYRVNENRFLSYTMQDGLPSVALECLSPVVNNTLWIASPNHLTQFDTRTHKSLVYDHHDGFPDEPPKSRYIYYDAGTGSFYLFFENELLKFRTPVSPPVTTNSSLLIQELSASNHALVYHPGDTIRLKYAQNNLSLQFNTIDYEAPESYRFEYNLNNTEWIALGNQRNLHLDRLQPGTVHFQLRATGKSGQQQQRHIIFFISPPFWQTLWFKLCVAALLTVLIFFLVKKRIAGIRRDASINKQLAEYEMKALHAQMNPHFIFNSLNSIKEMILEDQKHNASRYLSKFAQLIRMSLEHSRQTFITLGQSINHLEHYLEMEQLRFADFDYEIIISSDVSVHEIMIAPMLIQPIVENAIWHGLMSRKEDKKLYIRFLRENDRLICEVEDNGIGINASLKNKESSQPIHRSIGIENIRQRIAVLNEKYNIRYQLEIKDKEDIPGAKVPGTKAVISYPITDGTLIA